MENGMGILGGGFTAIWGFGIVWGVAIFLLSLYTLIDTTKSKFVEGSDKIMWALLIVLTVLSKTSLPFNKKVFEFS